MITDRIRLPDTFRKSVNGETKSTIVSLVPGQNTYTVAGQVPPSAAAGGGAGGGAVAAGSFPPPERYTGRNGRLDPSELVDIGNGRLLEKNAAAAFRLMNDAVYQEVGVRIVVTSAYRTYEKQSQLYNKLKGTRPVAAPGNSNHGLGIAIDAGNDSNSPIVMQWLVNNSTRFGFKIGYDANPYPFHYDYVGTGG